MLVCRGLRGFAQKLIGGGIRAADFTETAEELKEQQVTSGKAWPAQLLRLKSDEDLHKLWYVLLKERNVLLSDAQLRRQNKNPAGPQDRKKKVNQSMARILTVLRERELAREKYWQQLEEEYKVANTPPAPPKEKKEKNLTEEQIIQTQKRKEAIANIPNWKYMNNRRRRGAIKEQYGKMAKQAKEDFIKELRFVGAKLKEKGITNHLG